MTRWTTLAIVAIAGVVGQAWGGELTHVEAKPYLRCRRPGRPAKGPTLALRVQPRYAHTEWDTGQPTWLVPGDRTHKAHYMMRRLRLHLYGDIGPHLAYYFQVRRDSGLDQIDCHDAYVTYSGWSLADITVGQFKTPTDRLLVTSDGKVPLFERPRSSKLLCPDRDVGLMVHDGWRTRGRWAWYVGAFNGEGKNRSDGFGTLMWAGRVQWTATPRLSLGFSLAANNNTHRTLYSKFTKKNKDPYGLMALYRAGVMDETTWTVDAHYEDDAVRVFAGYMRKDLSAPGVSLPHADDWYVMAGWKVKCGGYKEGLEIVAGFEDFDPNTSVADSLDCRLYTLGINWRPHGPKGNKHFVDQFRLQYQWRDEEGPEIDNDSLILQYEMKFVWP